MGPVSGFVFEADETLYLVGDTIWYDPVEETLDQFEPDMVVLNGGEAQFDQDEPITMGVGDINAVCDATDATRSLSFIWRPSTTVSSRKTNCGRRQRMFSFLRTENRSTCNTREVADRRSVLQSYSSEGTALLPPE